MSSNTSDGRYSKALPVEATSLLDKVRIYIIPWSQRLLQTILHVFGTGRLHRRPVLLIMPKCLLLMLGCLLLMPWQICRVAIWQLQVVLQSLSGSMSNAIAQLACLHSLCPRLNRGYCLMLAIRYTIDSAIAVCCGNPVCIGVNRSTSLWVASDWRCRNRFSMAVHCSCWTGCLCLCLWRE